MERLININSYPINKVLKILLMDKTTGKNIIWATDTYTTNGRYKDTDTIETMDLVGVESLILQPRISKSLEEQQQRTRKKAEVFTPVWLCNQMNNYCDEQWFGRKDVFNIEREDHTWRIIKDKIEFPKGKNWKKYVDSRRLEITCGEAPFIVSRYDMATGDLIHPPKIRIGILDRKMRIVNENASDEEWIKWAIRAVQACYGYEYQGDNLLIARINMVLTFRDYYLYHFEEEPELKLLKKVATIISWNFWQMDGLKDTVPKGGMNETNHQLNIFEMFESEGMPEYREDIPCKIYNWRSNESLFYKDCKGAATMSKKLFDYCIGNPPYNADFDDSGENGNFAHPVYNEFMDAANIVSKKVELIHPARFLFNAGSTPKAWNEKMLNDPHFKVLRYEEDATVVFPNTDIKGGVAITYHDDETEFGPIGIFTKYTELNSIVKKVQNIMKGRSLADIIYTQCKFNLSTLYEKYPHYRNIIGSNGKDRRFRNNIFDKIDAFAEEAQNPSDIPVFGIIKNKRCWRYIEECVVDHEHENLHSWKAIIARANGSGQFGDTLSTPELMKPGEAYTQTFIGIGSFNTEKEANSVIKYLKTKFCRTMLGVLKVTQDNDREVWRLVPLQDFTNISDIDWSKSIYEIDQQLYKKYNLSQKEVDFIEKNVKEMN